MTKNKLSTAFPSTRHPNVKVPKHCACSNIHDKYGQQVNVTDCVVPANINTAQKKGLRGKELEKGVHVCSETRNPKWGGDD